MAGMEDDGIAYCNRDMTNHYNQPINADDLELGDPPRDSFVTQQGILFGELLDFEWLV